MQLARVIGSVVATQKDPRLTGVKLLVIQPVSSRGERTGSPIVACDSIGCGVGETVLYAKSKEGAFCLIDPKACCDAGITAIVDSIGHDKPPDGRILNPPLQHAAHIQEGARP